MLDLLAQAGVRDPDRELRALVEQGIFDAPRQKPTPHGGSQSYYTVDDEAALRQCIAQKAFRLVKGSVRVPHARLLAIKKLAQNDYSTGLLPSMSSDWERYVLDRTVLDVLYAENLLDLELLCYGPNFSLSDPRNDKVLQRWPKLKARAKELQATDAVAILTDDNLIVICLEARRSETFQCVVCMPDGKDVPPPDIEKPLVAAPWWGKNDLLWLPLVCLPENTQREQFRWFGCRRSDQLDPRGFTVYQQFCSLSPLENACTIRGLARNRVSVDDLMAVTAHHHLLDIPYSCTKKQFLSCFQSDAALRAFQNDVRDPLVEMLQDTLRQHSSDRIANAVDTHRLPASWYKLKSKLLNTDYLITDPDNLRPPEQARKLHSTPFVPLLFSVNAQTFTLGRLRHIGLAGAGPSGTFEDGLAKRFRVCARCHRLFLLTQAAGQGKVEVCGLCDLKKRKQNFQELISLGAKAPRSPRRGTKK